MQDLFNILSTFCVRKWSICALKWNANDDFKRTQISPTKRTLSVCRTIFLKYKWIYASFHFWSFDFWQPCNFKCIRRSLFFFCSIVVVVVVIVQLHLKLLWSQVCLLCPRRVRQIDPVCWLFFAVQRIAKATIANQTDTKALKVLEIISLWATLCVCFAIDFHPNFPYDVSKFIFHLEKLKFWLEVKHSQSTSNCQKFLMVRVHLPMRALSWR